MALTYTAPTSLRFLPLIATAFVPLTSFLRLLCMFFLTIVHCDVCCLRICFCLLDWLSVFLLLVICRFQPRIFSDNLQPILLRPNVPSLSSLSPFLALYASLIHLISSSHFASAPTQESLPTIAPHVHHPLSFNSKNCLSLSLSIQSIGSRRSHRVIHH